MEINEDIIKEIAIQKFGRINEVSEIMIYEKDNCINIRVDKPSYFNHTLVKHTLDYFSISFEDYENELRLNKINKILKDE